MEQDPDYQKNNIGIPKEKRMYEISRMMVEFQMRPYFFLAFLLAGAMVGLLLGLGVGFVLGKWVL